jgi:hypothetical protein
VGVGIGTTGYSCRTGTAEATARLARIEKIVSICILRMLNFVILALFLECVCRSGYVGVN